MKLSQFHYELPKELIAQEPLKKRDTARLMVLDRSSASITEKVFSDIIEHIEEGDALVLNDTKVMPARLYGRRKTGGKVEIFLLDVKGENKRALLRSSGFIREGEEIELENGVTATILGKADVGRYVSFSCGMDEVLKGGHVPLPPYIDRSDTKEDESDYQTVYARGEGATAAPTAGLHFTKELLRKIEEKGIRTSYVTLHTSYGTFAPVKEEEIEKHLMHSEYYCLTAEVADIINSAKSSGRKVWAVGTTSTRVLEASSGEDGFLKPSEGETNLFIYPGYKFKMVDGLITNFHLPESTLLMLVSAFAGKDLILKAYAEAIEKKFRFFSYGDAMLII